MKKSAKLLTSESWAALVKLTFHWTKSPYISIRSAIDASFSHAILNTIGNESLRVLSPHHISCQNFSGVTYILWEISMKLGIGLYIKIELLF